MTAVSTQAMINKPGEPFTSLAIPADTIKIPDPIIDPAMIAVESSSDSFFVDMRG
jgi:hypothetical protein